MTSRDAILSAVRAARPAPVARPDVAGTVASFPRPLDRVGQFVSAAEGTSARVLQGPRGERNALIAAAGQSTGRRVSAVEASVQDLVDASPHSFADTDLFVCEAVVGVAENGAVWLPLSRLRHRSAVFLATNVIVVLDAANVVDTMHDLYATVDVRAEGFGLLLAGPSKTADIEQSLVIGAHGAKQLTLVLLT